MDGYRSFAEAHDMVVGPSGSSTEDGAFEAWSDRAAPAPAPDLLVECVDWTVLLRHEAAWADLGARAIEPNVFLEPAFAVPLLQHLAATRRPSVLLVWEEEGPTSFGRLLGLVPLHLDGAGPRLSGIVRGFFHDQTACGMPLVDRARAVETLEAALTWLDQAGPGRFGALAIREIAANGPFMAALEAACAGATRRCAVLESHRRAVLPRSEGGADAATFASAKRRKERARLNRRLSEAGTRTYTSARTVEEVAAAMERFLALEHRGWKGRRRTSLLADPRLATFGRTMTRMLAADGRCRIDAIEIGGRPVAMGIALSAGARGYFWKTSFDESFAALSPGVQFALELTQAQQADPAIAMTDSCAIADHPMIDRLWPARMTVLDVMIELAPGPGSRFDLCRRQERTRRALRGVAKTAVRRLRRLAGRD